MVLGGTLLTHVLYTLPGFRVQGGRWEMLLVLVAPEDRTHPRKESSGSASGPCTERCLTGSELAGFRGSEQKADASPLGML